MKQTSIRMNAHRDTPLTENVCQKTWPWLAIRRRTHIMHIKSGDVKAQDTNKMFELMAIGVASVAWLMYSLLSTAVYSDRISARHDQIIQSFFWLPGGCLAATTTYQCTIPDEHIGLGLQRHKQIQGNERLCEHLHFDVAKIRVKFFYPFSVFIIVCFFYAVNMTQNICIWTFSVGSLC